MKDNIKDLYIKLKYTPNVIQKSLTFGGVFFIYFLKKL